MLGAVLGLGLTACGEAPPSSLEGVPDPPFVPLAAGGEALVASAGPRWILFLLIDALRRDHVGAFDPTSDRTPSLDRLAKGAFVFENATATSSWTRSSVASMFTSRYPSALGILGRTDTLAPGLPTLASQLALLGGYHTAGISTNGNAGAAIGFSQGFQEFWVPDARVSYPNDYEMVPGEAVTNEALAWLENRSRHERIFLFLHYTDPHDPYFAHPDLVDEPNGEGRWDGSRTDLEEMDRVAAGDLTDADRERIRELYSSEVRYADECIRRLVVGLRTLGVPDEDVLLVVTADHGEGLWDHGQRAHGTDLYQEMIRVPLLIRLPGQTKEASRRIDEPVSLIDLAPTLLALAGIDKPREFQGHDLSPLWKGRERPEALQYIYSEMDQGGVNLESMRLGDHKLIRNRDPQDRSRPARELYDLEKDPGERENLAGRKLPIEEHLQAALFKWRRALLADAPARTAERLETLDAATLESLRSLGYIGESEYREALRKQREGR